MDTPGSWARIGEFVSQTVREIRSQAESPGHALVLLFSFFRPDPIFSPFFFCPVLLTPGTRRGTSCTCTATAASTAGLMTLPVMGTAEGYTYEEAMLAIALGIALQITNIMRDVGEDAVRGRIYAAGGHGQVRRQGSDQRQDGRQLQGARQVRDPARP